MKPSHDAPALSVYLGLFFVALSTLMYEILLTRIFSVTMMYHFAFVALSVAMFGMTVGALAVYLRPAWFPPERTLQRLAVWSTAFPLVLVFSFLTELSIPFRVHPSIVAIYGIVLTYVVITLPFIVSGVCVCLTLTRFPARVGRLYAADLAGAALGCVLLVYTLEITDAPTAVFVVAFLAALGAVAFAVAAGIARIQRVAIVTAVALGGFAAAHTALVWQQFAVLRILYIRGSFEARPLYEKWNSYSRVRVNGDRAAVVVPTGWGLSERMPGDLRTHQLQMDLDVSAGTVMTGYNGDTSALQHLTYDVTNIAYWIRPNAHVLVVGAGGGRDVLSALTFGARQVDAVELNTDVLKTVNGKFGDFTGHLDRDPRVRFVNDEARSYLSRQSAGVDILQISLIDTWAATAAGAFVLSENSLYTREAWRVFLSRLNEGGILSVSRWYFKGGPSEMYRLAALAAASLRDAGIANPRDHLVIVRNMRLANKPDVPDGVGTLLASRTPFSAADLDRLEAECARLGFDVVLSPRVSVDETFAALASRDGFDEAVRRAPLNITPPTDDSPFFFNQLRVRDLLRRGLQDDGKQTHNLRAVFVLGLLLATVVVLTALCIGLPLALTRRSVDLRGSGPLLLYFAAIGLGFMLIETSQMQRLIIVLGHPTYGLSVVLFALLVSSGIGSFLAPSVDGGAKQGIPRLAALVVLLVLFGWATPMLVRTFEGATTPVRIAVAVLVLFPPGLLMGMAFPLGMGVAAATRAATLTPWLWAINGAMSVLASVLGVVIALTWSISTAFWVGVLCYVTAAIAYQRARARTVTAVPRSDPAPAHG